MAFMTVFHGGYTKIERPEIRVGRYTKDFGPGFYCTVMRDQAQRWARRFETPVVNCYEVRAFDGLNVKDFGGMTEEWLDFIVACRNGDPHEYDVVIGAMADDQIYNYIAAFIGGELTREQFWTMARFRYPTHQIAFCSQKSLGYLRFSSSEVVEPWTMG